MLRRLTLTANVSRRTLGGRLLSSSVKGKKPPMDDYEEQIYDILDRQLLPKSLEVRDISGGCGSMFSISIESDKFSGLSTIKQHRLVNTILKDEISKWHGLQLKTKKTE